MRRAGGARSHRHWKPFAKHLPASTPPQTVAHPTPDQQLAPPTTAPTLRKSLQVLPCLVSRERHALCNQPVDTFPHVPGVPNDCPRITPSTPPPSNGTDYATLAARFRPIFTRIAESSVERERTRTLPHEPIQWLKEAGFGAVRVPVEHGGAGASLPQLFQLLMGRKAAPAVSAAELKSWGRCAPHRDTRPLPPRPHQPQALCSTCVACRR